MSGLGDGAASLMASGDGVTSMTTSDDGVFPDADDNPDDGVFPEGDGNSEDGEGLSGDTQTLSVVVEPATLSISDELHVVQLIQVNWLDVVEYCSLEHATQVRSVLLVPLAAIFCPAMQVIQSVQ